MQDPHWYVLLVKASIVVGALTALGTFFYKFIWKPISNLKKRMVDRFADFYNKVNYITLELKPNGGNSLRDQVVYIRRVVEKIDQRQLSFFHFDPHGIVETDARGNLIWANRSYLDMVRRHPEEITGQGWRNVIIERDRDRVIHEWTQAVNDSRDYFGRFTMQDGQGGTFNVEARCLAMKDETGSLMGHLGFVIRMDRPPPGCRWCREVEILSDEVANMLTTRKQQPAAVPDVPTSLRDVSPPS